MLYTIYTGMLTGYSISSRHTSPHWRRLQNLRDCSDCHCKSPHPIHQCQILMHAAVCSERTHPETHHLTEKFPIYGFLLAILQMYFISLVLCFEAHGNLYHVVYLNALLANLNARSTLREEYSNGSPIFFDTSFDIPRAVVRKNVATSSHTSEVPIFPMNLPIGANTNSPQWVIDIRNH